MTDKAFILNRYPFTNKSVRRNLASCTYRRILLNLNKSSDLREITDLAAVEIHKLGMTGLWKNSPLLSWWGRRYADGAVVEECYRYHQCFASSLRGSRQYGITCTSLAGRTPCGWDDFTTDRTKHQPTGKWVGEAEYAQDHYVCNPGQHCSRKKELQHVLPHPLRASVRLQRGQVQREPGREHVLPLPEGNLTPRASRRRPRLIR